MPKVDADTGFAGVPGGVAHKGMADVEARDSVIAYPGNFYRQVPGTGGHLKHPCSWLEAVSDCACAFPGSTHVVRRGPGGPRGDDAFHRHPLLGPVCYRPFWLHSFLLLFGTTVTVVNPRRKSPQMSPPSS